MISRSTRSSSKRRLPILRPNKPLPVEASDSDSEQQGEDEVEEEAEEEVEEIDEEDEEEDEEEIEEEIEEDDKEEEKKEVSIAPAVAPAAYTTSTSITATPEWTITLAKYDKWKKQYEKTHKKKHSDKETPSPIPVTTMDLPMYVTTDLDEALPPPELAVWVCEQRILIKDKMLGDEVQQIAFNTVDNFDWNDTKNERLKANRLKYDLFLAKLRHFKLRFGHVNVPIRWKEDSQLGKWVSRQRDMARRTQEGIGEEKTAALEALGFVWYKPPGNTIAYAEKQHYKEQREEHPLASNRVDRSRYKNASKKHSARSMKQVSTPKQVRHPDDPALMAKARASWENSINATSMKQALDPFSGTQESLSAAVSNWHSTHKIPHHPAHSHPNNHHRQMEVSHLEALTRMAQDKPTWYSYYHKAHAYYQQYGHCNIASAVLKEDVSLQAWINVQKQILAVAQKHPGMLDLMLDPTQLGALEHIGMTWWQPNNTAAATVAAQQNGVPRGVVPPGAIHTTTMAHRNHQPTNSQEEDNVPGTKRQRLEDEAVTQQEITKQAVKNAISADPPEDEESDDEPYFYM